jgi:hypothetical protein
LAESVNREPVSQVKYALCSGAKKTHNELAFLEGGNS